MRARAWLTIAWLAGCGSGDAAPAPAACAAPACVAAEPTPCGAVVPVRGTRFSAAVIATGFSSPVHLAAPPGDPRVFVVEQGGTIRRVDGVRPAAQPYLDISARVLAGGERGLLGLAFHPRFAENGRLFVHYTARPAGEVRISEFRAADPSSAAADPGSERVLVAIDHSAFANHNGGQVAFGPDGLLYAGVGDGGGSGDPFGNAQDTGALLGKILRIDPDAPATPAPGNPHGNAVYHHGLRNPWRFSFDRRTGDLYVGDVGQNAWEEVDFAAAPRPGAAPAAGTNWGWDVLEGRHCFAALAGCTPTGVLPVHEYPHAEGFSITGGFVYRGDALPDLAATGTYFYADFGSGFVRTLRVQGGAATDHQDVTATFAGAGNVSSFGEDGCGELYVVSYQGAILKLVPPR